MGLLFPLLAVFAIAVFAASAAVSVVLALLTPLFTLFVGFALIFSFRPIWGFRVVSLGFSSVGTAVGFFGAMIRCIFSPLEDRLLADGKAPERFVRMKPAAFPSLSRAVKDVAEQARVAMPDELWVTPDHALGVGWDRDQGVRFLAVGLGMLRVLTPLELRAVLGHEFGHLRGHHVALQRVMKHALRMLIDARLSFRFFNPARWGSELALGVIQVIYFPWSRAREHAADDFGAKLAGTDALISALRKTREHAPVADICLSLVAQRVRDIHCGPTLLVRASELTAQLLTPVQRRTMSVATEGDPLDLGGRTHPPTSARVHRLSQRRVDPPRASQLAISDRELELLEQRLTKEWLHDFPVRTWLPAEDFVRGLREAEHPVKQPEQGAAIAEADSESLELDFDRSWRKSG